MSGQTTVLCESEILWVATTGREFHHRAYHSEGWASTNGETLLKEKMNIRLGGTDGTDDR